METGQGAAVFLMRPVPAVDVSVDPRIELVGVIFRLAGNPEYGQCKVPSYERDLDEHFGPFKDHPVVELAATLRRTRGVGYDAPMSLAVHLADASELNTLVPINPRPSNVDDRWHPDDLRRFLALARQFVVDARFDEFFGPRRGARFHLVLGMLNGASSYGVRTLVNSREDLYCVLGVWRCDRDGAPVFPPDWRRR